MNTTFRKILSSQLTQTIFSASLLKVVGVLIGYIFILLVGRDYGSEVLGLFVMSFTILQIVSVIAKLGTDTYMLRFTAEYVMKNRWNLVKELYFKVLILVIPLGLICSIILYVLIPYLSMEVFHNHSLTMYLLIICMSILPYALLTINAEALKGIQNIKVFSFLQYVSIFLFSLIALIILSSFFTSQLIPIISFSFGIYFSFICSHFMWKKHIQNTTVKEKKITFKEVLHKSIPMMYISSIAFIMMWTDNIILGMLSSASSVGIYSVSLKIASIVGFLLPVVNSITAPKFSTFWANQNFDGLYTVAYDSSKFLFFTTFLLFFILIIGYDNLIVFFGKEFNEGETAFFILAIGQLINSLSGSTGYFLSMTNNHNVAYKIMFLALCMNIILNIILIPLYNMVGAAIATSLSMIFWNTIMLIVIYKKFHFWLIYIPFQKKGNV